MAAVNIRGVSHTGKVMGERRSFRALLALAIFTALLMAMSALAPPVVGGLLHHENMAADMSVGDVLIVCALIPSISDWHVPALAALPLCLLVYVLFSGVWDMAAQWYRTRRLIAQLRQYRCADSGSGSPYEPAWGSSRRSSWRPSWEELVRRVDLERKVDLIEANRPLAFCYGWLFPRVCISTGTLAIMEDTELEAILLHERFHLLRRDPLRNAVSQALARVFFFLPLIGALQKDFVVCKEIEADKHVLDVSKLEMGLLSALSKMIMCRPAGGPAGNTATEPAVTGSSLAGSTECVDHRIDYLLKGTLPGVAPSKRSLWASCVVIGVLALIVIAATWHASSAAVAYQHICNLRNCGLIPLVH